MTPYSAVQVICPYCGKEACVATGREIYPGRRYLYHKYFYACRSCDAYVGCHWGSKKPLGRLANAQLRRAKLKAHDAFDRIWKSGHMTRIRAYHWLSQQLEITEDECHIGMFDIKQCRKVVEACNAFKGK